MAGVAKRPTAQDVGETSVRPHEIYDEVSGHVEKNALVESQEGQEGFAPIGDAEEFAVRGEDQQAVDGQQEDEAEDDGVEVGKPMRRPYSPTKEEWIEHMATHVPFRSCCPFCIAGRGISGHHTHDEEQQKVGVTVSLDDCFMGSLDAEGNTAPIRIMYDDGLGHAWALGVSTKELSDSVVGYCVGKMDLAGHRGEKVTLKSGGEPAITAVKRAIADARVGTSPC